MFTPLSHSLMMRRRCAARRCDVRLRTTLNPTRNFVLYQLPFLLLDRYDVSSEIGRGANAVVYRARDRVLGRDVAIKLIRDDIASPHSIARFAREIQLTARLEHAHILHVYDTGSYEGRPFVVMELASGRSLAERLNAEGQLSIEESLQITRDVGNALAHAHANAVIHRDVKPENILLTPAGAFIADFGIARITEEHVAETIDVDGNGGGHRDVHESRAVVRRSEYRWAK